MKRWLVSLAMVVVVHIVKNHRFFWPIAASFARGRSLIELLKQIASMTDTSYDDLLMEASFRDALRGAIDSFDGPDDEGLNLYDAFLSRIEEALE